jgi:hypothetical protein
VSEGPSLDTHELLRLLADQQTCLGQQLASLSQLQRLVVEHLLGSASSQNVPTAPSAADAEQRVAGVVATVPAPALTSPVRASTPEGATGQTDNEGHVATDAEPLAGATANAALAPEPAAPEPPVENRAAPIADSPIGEAPPLQTVDVVRAAVTPAPAGFNSRAGRYMQPSAPAQAKRVTSQDVNRVARLYEVGEAAHLVLQFGEYRGASLVQVARADPDYIRSLALTAQRPQVRAAASAMVRALEASERTATRRRHDSSRT